MSKKKTAPRTTTREDMAIVKGRWAVSVPAEGRVVRFTPKPHVAKNLPLLQLWRQLDPSFQAALIKIMKIRIAAPGRGGTANTRSARTTSSNRVIQTPAAQWILAKDFMW